jgi:hypothetical protein
MKKSSAILIFLFPGLPKKACPDPRNELLTVFDRILLNLTGSLAAEDKK